MSRSSQRSRFFHRGSEPLAQLEQAQTRPKTLKDEIKVGRHCMSVYVTLSTGQGQDQVTKGHYNEKTHLGHVIHGLFCDL